MSSTLSQKITLEIKPAIAQTQDQKSNQTVEDHHSDKMDARDRANQSRKRQRMHCGEARIGFLVNEAAAGFDEQTQESEERLEGPKGKRHVEDKEESQPTGISHADNSEISTNEYRQQAKEKTQTVSEEVQNIDFERLNVFTSEEAKREPAKRPFASYLTSSINMVFPKDEIPIELCPFSSDESAGETKLKCHPRRTNNLMNTVSKNLKACSISSAAALKLKETLAVTSLAPVPVTAKDAANSETRSMGKRKCKTKLSYSASRNKYVTRPKHDENSVPAAFALEKLTIAANGNAAGHEGGVDFDRNAPASPVYPDADASHLYPPTFEGESWQWRDAETYFNPLMQGDLDNLARWRKENAGVVAANSRAWCGVPGMERKRAVLESILADASNRLVAHMDISIRRGRHYRDVWEEADFLAQRRRDKSVEDIYNKKQEITMKMKHKGFTHSGSSLLESHCNLVYGYDDDLFEDFTCRLEDRAKLYPIARRQVDASAKVDEYFSDKCADEIVFDEIILPTYPVCQLHPASLGLWKLQKSQNPDFSVVHPASLNRDQVPTRWKEEMRRHCQRAHADQLADPSDGDDGGNWNAVLVGRSAISNSDVNEILPSFGNEVEKDEISKVLAASIRKLIPLSFHNWQIAQRVHERAACSIQCAPLLESEAAAARELENVFLQLCSSAKSNADITVPTTSTGSTRQLRALQINSAPHDIIAYSTRHDIADNCSLAVAASVEFALRLRVGDVVDVLDKNGCWNYGEVVETYKQQKNAKFLLLQFSLWSEDTVEWIATSEGRILPQGIATGLQSYSVGPTCAHRDCICYDQCLARELERSFQRRQANATSHALAQWQNNDVVQFSADQQTTSQKSKRKRPHKSVATTSSCKPHPE